jgi:photosystem II stability/assembly factor-like uncharacterized protein
MIRSYLVCWIVLGGLCAAGWTQEESKLEKEQEPSELADKYDAGLLGSISFRSIGPALMSGRISDIAVDSRQPNTWYVAAGSGGVWKTVNAGTTWTPIFDQYGSYSIGCVALDPSDRNTVWVGTGEAVGGRHVGFGDGIYVSRDGGQSFTHMGLKSTEHIAKIVVDPRNSRNVYVAAQGPLWSSGGERGLYKSTDGGKSWNAVLTKGQWTGVTDVVLDPKNSRVVYAATHQRHRTVAALINGGPESGIHKSTDGGATWTELKNGLPGEDKGKIALAVSPFDSNVVYATIELANRTGGFYRSANAGASWSKMSDYTSGGTGPHYYQEIWVDPHRLDSVYHANVVLGRTDDGGKSFHGVGNDNKHVDNHAVAFHPTDPDFLLVGCDGGVYKSFDRGATFQFVDNLPLTQFYKVDVDYDYPVYHVIGGTQDNNTQYGPTRTLNANGIRNSDWRITIGGDGHDCAIDPEDPNIMYCESQEGYLRRFDRATGQSVDIRPQPGGDESDLRFNWDSPILISPHSHTRLYYGSKQLHRSDNRGDQWQAISGDLPRGVDRFGMKIMGRVWALEAIWDLMAMSAYGNITSISESPLVEGLIYVGTDAGLIQVTEDGGKNWRKIDKIFGVPEFFFVNDIKADLHDANTVYVCVDHHKTGDFKPYVLVSHDRGATWESIAGDLPERHLVWRIIQDHVRPELLFVGTEFGVFATIDQGQHWLKLAGMPNIPVRDLAIHKRENDLVAATFGRGFYVLDDYSPLRELSPSFLEQHDFHVFPVRPALLYLPDDLLGGRRGSQGDGLYSADNPPYGAVFNVYIKSPITTKKQARLKQDEKTKSAGGDTPYPGWEAIKAEDREQDPSLVVEIKDARGQVVNRFNGPTSAGVHRVVWDLSYAPVGGMVRSLAAPGAYSVQFFRRWQDQTSPLGEPQPFEVVSVIRASLPGQDGQQILAFQDQASALQQSVSAAGQIIQSSLDELKQVRAAIAGGRRGGLELLDSVRGLELKLLDARELLFGDRTAAQRFADNPPSVSSRIGTALFGTMQQTYGPTQTHRDQLDLARQDYDRAIGTIRGVVETELEQLRQRLDQAGVPWTPGRKIPEIPGSGSRQ